MPESKMCARCGVETEDLRTLHMACFYAMEELGIMFDRQVVLIPPEGAEYVQAKEPSVLQVPNGPAITLSSGTVRTDAELRPMQTYNLRVCKGCRAEWMNVIASWFNAGTEKTSPGTGIFIRRNGDNVEVTQEEYEEYQRIQKLG